MDHFFGLHVASNSSAGMTLALVLSVILSGLIGLEREVHGHPAGLRTHILVCVGSTLLTIVSVQVGQMVPGTGRGDPGRIAAQIVSGIGFLGAGAIIRDGASIRGLTTAASVWATAGIGIAVGVGPQFAELAVIATAIVLFTLWALNKLETRLDIAFHRVALLGVHVRDSDHAAARTLAQLASHKVEVSSLSYDVAREPHTRHILFRVRLPGGFDRNAFLSDLSEEPGVLGVNLD